MNTRAESAINRILVGIDGSENAMRAANVAIELARSLSAELIVLHVVALSVTAVAKANVNPSYDDELQQNLKTAHEDAVKLVEGVTLMANSKQVKTTSKIQEYATSVVESILEEAAKNHVDLIVIGTRGLTGFKKLLLGSVSSGVATHAPCSVMVVR